MKFKGYCSLYDTNYYDAFIVDKHAFKESDGRKVPVLKDYGLNDPNNVVGYAIINDTDKGVIAHCVINDDVIINDDTVLDAHITFVKRADNNPVHIVSGKVKAVYLSTKEYCSLHDSVTIEEE